MLRLSSGFFGKTFVAQAQEYKGKCKTPELKINSLHSAMQRSVEYHCVSKTESTNILYAFSTEAALQGLTNVGNT